MAALEDDTLGSPGTHESFRPAGRVGRYVVLDKIGQGGMGVVYSAYDDELDRKVALKLINPRGSPRAAQQRLIREARTMARLQHPNVVVVYDAQTVGDAVYVAMEFVPGSDVRAWREARPRALAEIVDVFVQAGRGLAAAHAAGIVHRDFKPANVLVGEDGRARVADFGLAVPAGEIDAADEPPPAEEDSRDRVTRSGDVVGTPAYMSPEQHRRQAATPLSDQFSFCMSLYEALCDQRPFTPTQLATGELPAPEAPGAPAWLRAVLVRGLARDPNDRFPTLDALLRELARDPAARRRRWAAAAGAVMVAGAAAWGVVAWRGSATPCGGAAARLEGVWDDAARARVRGSILATHVPFAEAAWAGAARVLDGYADRWVKAHGEACRATRVRGEQSEEVLGRRMACLEQRRQSLAATVGVLGAADAEVVENAVRAAHALPELDGCSDVTSLLAQVPLPDDPEVRARVAEQRGRIAEASALHGAGKYPRALEMVTEVTKAARPLAHLPLVAEAELLRGDLLDETGDFPGAEEALYEAVYAGEAGHHEEVVAKAWIDLLFVVGGRQRRFADVGRIARLADAALQRLGDPPRLRARYWNYLASGTAHQGKFEDTEAYYRRALALLERNFGPAEPQLSDVRFNLGTAALHRGRYAEALATFEQALPTYQTAYGPEHPHTARCHHAIGNALLKLERFPEAADAYARAVAIRERALGPDHADLGNSLNGLGAALAELGRHDEALDKYKRALAIKEKALGADHPSVANTVVNIGEAYLDKGDLAAARPWLERALAARRARLGDDHPDVADALQKLARLELREGKRAQALAAAEQALAIYEKGKAPADAVARVRAIRDEAARH